MKDIIELLSSYSLDTIVIFIVVLSFAIKGIIDFIDWAKKRINSKIGHAQEELMEQQHIKENIENLFKMQLQQKEAIDSLTKSVDLLLQSDKDDIKAWITEQHHYFCYELKYIDDFSLDCIERRYTHYRHEGGNSFVDSLMVDLRSLKKVSSTLITQEVGTKHHSKK